MGAIWVIWPLTVKYRIVGGFYAFFATIRFRPRQGHGGSLGVYRFSSPLLVSRLAFLLLLLGVFVFSKVRAVEVGLWE